MKKLTLIIALLALALPLAAMAHTDKHGERHKISVSDDSGFDIRDGKLVITHGSGWNRERVVVTEDGDLKINRDRIETSDREREMLREFYQESDKLEQMAMKIAAQATEIAAASTRYATAQVAAALREISDEDHAGLSEAEDDAAEDRFEAEIEAIEKFADKIEDQADVVSEIAEDLQEAIPELAELTWFFED